MSCVISAQVVRARDGLDFEQYLVVEAIDDVLTVGRSLGGLACEQWLEDWDWLTGEIGRASCRERV